MLSKKETAMVCHQTTILIAFTWLCATLHGMHVVPHDESKTPETKQATPLPQTADKAVQTIPILCIDEITQTDGDALAIPLDNQPERKLIPLCKRCGKDFVKALGGLASTAGIYLLGYFYDTDWCLRDTVATVCDDSTIPGGLLVCSYVTGAYAVYACKDFGTHTWQLIKLTAAHIAQHCTHKKAVLKQKTS
jgi:hypothetical protein